jgi:predicted secreted protein
MSIVSVFALYCTIWAIVFYMINPLWQTTQHEDGEVVPGSAPSAPVNAMVKKKVILTTLIATAVFILAYLITEYRWLILDDISFIKLPSERH